MRTNSFDIFTIIYIRKFLVERSFGVHSRSFSHYLSVSVSVSLSVYKINIWYTLYIVCKTFNSINSGRHHVDSTCVCEHFKFLNTNIMHNLVGFFFILSFLCGRIKGNVDWWEKQHRQPPPPQHKHITQTLHLQFGPTNFILKHTDTWFF